jgi:hypothetical protein
LAVKAGDDLALTGLKLVGVMPFALALFALLALVTVGLFLLPQMSSLP